MRNVFNLAGLGVALLVVLTFGILFHVQGQARSLEDLQTVRSRVDDLTEAYRNLNRPGNDVLESWDHVTHQAAFQRYLAAHDGALADLRELPDPDATLRAFVAAYTAEAESMNTEAQAILTDAADRSRLLAQSAPVELVQAEETAAATHMAKMDQAFQRGLDVVTARNRELAAAQSDVMHALYRDLVGLLALLVVAFSGCLVLLRRASQQSAALAALTQTTGRIVADRDLTQAVRVEDAGDVGLVSRAFGETLGALRQILVSLRGSAGTLTRAVGQLRTSAEHQNQATVKNAAALQETQVTAQEIKQMSVVAADKAESVLRIAGRADEISLVGEQAVERSLAGLNEILAQVDEIVVRITRLKERTRQIEGITATVKDLADQSNMLALNATIEAVRSGEHGKGFAVVAREIRSLADQSIRATARVREILDDLGGAIQDTAELAAAGRGKMESGLDQVQASGATLRELSTIVKDTASAARQIAAAVSQQNAGIAQIFTALTEQNAMMEETVRSIEATNSAVDMLSEVSASVDALAGTYRV